MRPSESSPELARPPKQAARCAYTCCVPAGRHEDGAESGDTDEAVHGRLTDLVAIGTGCVAGLYGLRERRRGGKETKGGERASVRV